MKWLQKRKVHLKVGMIRYRIKFAWFPVDLYSGKTVWLENYIIKERWFQDGEKRETKSCTIIAMGRGWRIVRLFEQHKT